MSGGVDSSVVAALLKDQGMDVIGATLQVWDYSKTNAKQGLGTCCSHKDVQDARMVCDILNIPFYVLNTEEVFEKTVIEPFVSEYSEGKTPIPCLNCNSFLKFEYLVKKMEELECDYLATGHYAKIKKLKDGRMGLFKSLDSFKDQSYFLFTLPSSLLPRLLFPLESLSKDEVREIARQKALPVSAKKDSTGICFIGKGDYSEFVEKYNAKKGIALKGGDIKLFSTGEVLGSHSGIHHFTIGQRKGLGVSSNRPLFVIKIDKKTNEVFLGDEEHLYARKAFLKDMAWLDEALPGEEVSVKVRFHDRGSLASLHKSEDSYYLKFHEPKKAITPGQAAVIYRGAQVLGGGIIEKRL